MRIVSAFKHGVRSRDAARLEHRHNNVGPQRFPFGGSPLVFRVNDPVERAQLGGLALRVIGRRVLHHLPNQLKHSSAL